MSKAKEILTILETDTIVEPREMKRGKKYASVSDGYWHFIFHKFDKNGIHGEPVMFPEGSELLFRKESGTWKQVKYISDSHKKEEIVKHFVKG